MKYKHCIIDNLDSRGRYAFHGFKIGEFVEVCNFLTTTYYAKNSRGYYQYLLPKHLASVHPFKTKSGKSVFL